MNRAPRISERSVGRDNNFNLLRMIAATGVLVSHAYPLTLGPAAVQPLEKILKGTTLGTVSVLVFFSISGFFIARSFDRKASLRTFVLARVLRLFPALAVVLAVTIVVAGLFLTQASPSVFWARADDYFLRNLTLFQLLYPLPGVFMNNPYGPGINGSLWTLSYEVLCYIGVFICGVLGLLRRPRAFVFAVLGFLGLYAIALAFDLHPRFEALMKLGLPFLTGMAFYVWRRSIPLSPFISLALFVIAAAFWITPLFLPVFTIALTYAVFVVGYAKSPIAEKYNTLGDYSYGTYIYAFPIQQIVAQSGVESPLMNMAVAFPLTLVFAVLSWHLVERPAIRLRRRAADPVRPLRGAAVK